MDHEELIHFLRGGIPGLGGTWADLGSGSGAFTMALADLIGPTGHIYSVDKDERALREQERTLTARFPDTRIRYIVADFTTELDLPSLDGVVMANSLHFQRDKDPVLRQVRRYLHPGGRLIIVEYNADKGNWWVPYPFSYTSWETIAQRNGFTNTQLLAHRPSRFLGEMYSALSIS